MSWMGSAALDFYRPWVWPRPWQLGAGLLLFGVGAGGCVWLELGVDRLEGRRTAQAQHAQALKTLAELQAQIAEKRQQAESHAVRHPPIDLPATQMPRLRAAAQDAGLTVVSVQVHPLDGQASHMSWVVNGKTQSVWLWLQQMGQASAAMVLQDLEMQAGPAHAVQVKATWRWAPITHTSLQAGTAQTTESAAEGVGFDATHWGRVQRLHAAQHPSYVQWVLPELQRSRQRLEQFPLSAMRYRGHIAKPFASLDAHQALVHILDQSAAMHPVVRVGVGSYIGPNFGKVQAIAADHLILRELWRNDQGVWAPRWLKWPLGEGDATVISLEEAS